LERYESFTTASLSAALGDIGKLDNWHLQVLGVVPQHQRKGLGTALIRPIALKAREKGLSLIVETETEDAVVFYVTVGFLGYGKTVIEGYSDGERPPRVSPMWCLALGAEKH